MIRKPIRFSPNGAANHIPEFTRSVGCSRRLDPVSCLSLRARIKRLAWKRIRGNRGRRSFCLGPCSS